MSSIMRSPSSTDLIGVFSLWSDKSFPVYPAHERALLDSGDPKRLRPGAATVRDTFSADVTFLALRLIAAAAALDLESSPAAGVNEPDAPPAADLDVHSAAARHRLIDPLLRRTAPKGSIHEQASHVRPQRRQESRHGVLGGVNRHEV